MEDSAAPPGPQRQPASPQPTSNTGYPGVAQIAGHALSGIFLDALTVNIERLQRVNRKPPYTRALKALGEADTVVRRAEVLAFFGGCPPPA